VGGGEESHRNSIAISPHYWHVGCFGV
jgi:hypothetical protein